jgi:hypothetical protein
MFFILPVNDLWRLGQKLHSKPLGTSNRIGDMAHGILGLPLRWLVELPSAGYVIGLLEGCFDEFTAHPPSLIYQIMALLG